MRSLPTDEHRRRRALARHAERREKAERIGRTQTFGPDVLAGQIRSREIDLEELARSAWLLAWRTWRTWQTWAGDRDAAAHPLLLLAQTAYLERVYLDETEYLARNRWWRRREKTYWRMAYLGRPLAGLGGEVTRG